MTNTNFPLQFPCLTNDKYEIWCIRVKSWLGSQVVWKRVEKEFEELMEAVTLTSSQRETVQKAQRKDQQAFTIIH